MITIRDRNFTVVSRSKNLRGVLRRCAAFDLSRVDIWPTVGGGALFGLAWVDGSTSIFNFADLTIAKRFFESRVSRRGWPVPIIHLKESK